MRRLPLCLALSVLAGPLLAQSSITVESLDPTQPSVVIEQPNAEVFSLEREQELGIVTKEVSTPVVKGTGALLRGLDKLNGKTVDFELKNGFSIAFGDLRVDLAECRHPEDNAAGEAYAFLSIYEGMEATAAPEFRGWMVASSPALNALDHARYDVWVMRCKTN